MRLLEHLAESEDEFESTKLELAPGEFSSEREYVRQLPDLPESFAGPIVGCRCQSCKVFFRSASFRGGDFGELFQLPKLANSVRRFKDDLEKLTMMRNAKLILEVGMRILIKRNRVGTVRYLGHLEKSPRKNMVKFSIAFSFFFYTI